MVEWPVTACARSTAIAPTCISYGTLSARNHRRYSRQAAVRALANGFLAVEPSFASQRPDPALEIGLTHPRGL
jgi:hypothetical protein